MTGEVTDILHEMLFGMALFWQKAIEFFTKFIFSHTEQNAYLARNFTAYLFYRSLSDWAEYGLLGHRSMRS